MYKWKYKYSIVMLTVSLHLRPPPLNPICSWTSQQRLMKCDPCPGWRNKGTNGVICLTMTRISVCSWTREHPGRQRLSKVQVWFPSRAPGVLQYTVPHIAPLRYGPKSSRRGRTPPPPPPVCCSTLHLKAASGDSSSGQLWGRAAAASSSPADSGTRR